MLLLAPVILTLWTRGRITEHLPSEILESICDYSEEFPEHGGEASEASDRNFASNPVPQPEYEADLASIDMPSDCHSWPEFSLKKHQKNLFILSMTHVCRSWRLRLIGLKRPWREIAFSAEIIPRGIRMATHFLARLKDDDTNLHIYAGLPFCDIIDPSVEALLSKLRDQTHRWEKFFYWGRLGPYRPYLNLPAPRLRYFSDNHDLCHLYSGQIYPFFAEHTPVLQSLVTSALGSWQPTSLTDLQKLDLWDCAPGLSIRSLLDMLHHTPQLVEINIVSPNFPLLDYSSNEVVNLPRLKNLKVQNPDFYAIIGHLVIPNVQLVHLYCPSACGSNASQTGRAFQTPHPFVGLAQMTNQLPMFGQPIHVASIDASCSSGPMVTIVISVERGASLRIDLEWTGRRNTYLDMGYIQRSISALAEMPFLSPSSLHITASHALVDDKNPLFQLDAIETLVVEGGWSSRVITILSIHSGQLQLLPRLRYLCFANDELDEKMIMTIPNFLRSRRNLVIVSDPENRINLFQLLNHVCVIEGDFVSLKTISLI